MEYKVNEILYRFDEMLHTKYIGIERNNLIDILIHNDTERINSTNYFICAFISSLNKKGHTHKYLNDTEPVEEKNKDKVNGKVHTIKSISHAKIINLETYETLIKQQQKNKEISREEFYEIQRFYYSRVFKVEPCEVNEKWLTDRYDKANVPKNWNKLNLKNEDRHHFDDTDYLIKFGWERIDNIKKLLGLLGVSIEDNKIVVNNEVDYEKSSDEILKFISDKKFKTLFNNDRQIKGLNVLKVLNENFVELQGGTEKVFWQFPEDTHHFSVFVSV